MKIDLKFPEFVDSFEWDINNPDNDPMEFAALMASDLGLKPELDFTIAIAYEIQKQIQVHMCQRIQFFINNYENYVKPNLSYIKNPVKQIDLDLDTIE